MSLNIDVYFDEQVGSGFDEIASIFTMRHAKSEQHLTLAPTILEPDARIKALIRYLLLKKEITAEIVYECLDEAQGLDFANVSDAFASAVLAFASEDPKWIARVVNGYLALENGGAGLAQALAWLPWQLSSPWLDKFLRSKDLNHKYLAVSAAALLGKCPVEPLQQLIARQDCQQHLLLFERLLFTAGQLKQSALHPILRDATEHGDAGIQNIAHWARWMLNDRNFAKPTMAFSLTDSEAFALLSPWIVLSSPFAQSSRYIAAAMANPELPIDLIILAIAMHGDPSTLVWLLQKYHSPAALPWLALAFHQITGVALDHPSLAMDSAGDIENSDDDKAYYSHDMSIPHVNHTNLVALAHHVTRGMAGGQRYFLGQAVQDFAHTAARCSANPLGLARQYTSLCSALSGQVYIPYTFLKPQHHEGPHVLF